MSVGVCGEGLDVGVSAGQVCECGENKTLMWEWIWGVWRGVGCECVCGVELSVA